MHCEWYKLTQAVIVRYFSANWFGRKSAVLLLVCCVCGCNYCNCFFDEDTKTCSIVGEQGWIFVRMLAHMTRRVFSSQRSITNAALNLEAFVQTSMRSVLLGSVCSSEVLRRFNVLTAGILPVDKGLHGESYCPSLS